MTDTPNPVAPIVNQATAAVNSTVAAVTKDVKNFSVTVWIIIATAVLLIVSVAYNFYLNHQLDLTKKLQISSASETKAPIIKYVPGKVTIRTNTTVSNVVKIVTNLGRPIYMYLGFPISGEQVVKIANSWATNIPETNITGSTFTMILPNYDAMSSRTFSYKFEAKDVPWILVGGDYMLLSQTIEAEGYMRIMQTPFYGGLIFGYSTAMKQPDIGVSVLYGITK